MRDLLRRNPLFSAALLFSALIFLARAGGVFDGTSPNELARHLSAGRTPVYLGGVIDSEVSERAGNAGERELVFVVNAKKMWTGPGDEAVGVSGRSRVYADRGRSPLAYGDEVVLKGELARPKGLTNPGGFDQRAYLERAGIRSLFFTDRKTEPKRLRSGQGNPVIAKAIRLKQALSTSLENYFAPRESAFLKALFLGERSDLDESVTDLFVKTGTVHILSVSGFNVGFLAVIIFGFLSPFPVPRKVKSALVLAAIWAYCLVVGWQAPVVRASIMATVLAVGELVGRRARLVNSLGLAALVILSLNPRQLFDVGFQLSFLAVFGIGVLLPLFWTRPKLLPNERRTAAEKTAAYAKELFWLTFVCSLSTLPITVQAFYGVSPVSLLANLVVVPLTFLIFLAGAVFFPAALLPFKAAAVLPSVVAACLELMLKALGVLESVPGAYVVTGALPWIVWGALVTGLCWLIVTSRIRRAGTRAAAVVLFVSNIFLAQNLAHYTGRQVVMTAIDVGQGDSLYLEFPGGGNLLVDAGKGGSGDKGRFAVVPFLKSKGVRSIDLVVFSHPQADHIGGMPSVLDEFNVRAVLESGAPYASALYRDVERAVRGEKCARFIGAAGGSVEGFPGVTIELFNPAPGGHFHNDANEDSLVLRITHGRNRFLLTGDIGEKAMRGMLASGRDFDADVLKVPHHGAKWAASGENWLERVDPSVSVISAGDRNPFGHPAESTLAALGSREGNTVYRTDRDGAVRVASDGKTIRVELGPVLW